MQLHWAATSLDCSVETVFGYTIHCSRRQSTEWLCNHVSLRRLLSFWGLQPCDTWRHV